jgi:hypothetical protein
LSAHAEGQAVMAQNANIGTAAAVAAFEHKPRGSMCLMQQWLNCSIGARNAPKQERRCVVPSIRDNIGSQINRTVLTQTPKAQNLHGLSSLKVQLS